MALSLSWSDIFDQGRILYVIQYQQPPEVSVEPVLDCRDNAVLILLILPRQIQQSGEAHQVGAQYFAVLGTGPQHCLVILAMAIGIFNSGLCLTTTTQTGDGLGLPQGCCATRGKQCVETSEDVITPCEERIAAKGNIPHWPTGKGRMLRLAASFLSCRDKTQLFCPHPKDLAEPLAVVETGRGRAIFPATDAQVRGVEHARQFGLCPVSLLPLPS